MISILRHDNDPLCFKILAVSTDTGEEYTLDLVERDLMELTEGESDILQFEEPKQLIEMIIANLNLI